MQRSREPPRPGELLGRAPPWPREWAQRLGRKAAQTGARSEVFHQRSTDRWAIRWKRGGRTLLTLYPSPEGVEAELRLGGIPALKLRTWIDSDPLLREGLTPGPRTLVIRTGLDGPVRARRLEDLLAELARMDPA